MKRKGYLFSLLLMLILLICVGTLQIMSAETKKKEEAIHELMLQNQQQQEVIKEYTKLNNVLLEKNQELERRLEYQEKLQEFLDEFTVKTFEATAYTHVAIPGQADINGTGDGITAAGERVREGLIAVDPSVIPLGAEVFVEGYGVMLASDTGGAIRGNRIDIFKECQQSAVTFGRQELKVIFQEGS